MDLESQYTALLIIMVLVAVSARRMRIPYTIAMVLTGLAISSLRLDTSVTFQLEPHLILEVFLPALLFEAGYHLDVRELRDNIGSIALLAVAGTLLSMLVIGLVLNQLLGLNLVEALLFGIMISATDPIAVVAIFKELGVPKRLNVIVEGESLFNDGVAIVAYGILVGVATGETSFSLSDSIVSFFVTIAGGILLGLVTGFLAGEFMKRNEDSTVDIAATALLVYGTHFVAEQFLHEAVSPVIAVVVAAIYVGNYASRGDYSATSHTTINSFWGFNAFLINSIIFILIGMSVHPTDLLHEIDSVAAAIGAILLARAVVVYGLGSLARMSFSPIPFKWTHVLFWGGLRGAVSIALVLSLSSKLDSWGLLKTMTLGCIAFSLLVQGLSMRSLLNVLGIGGVNVQRQEYERRRARALMAQAAMRAVEALRNENILIGTEGARLEAAFRSDSEEQWHELKGQITSEPDVAEADARYVMREIGETQKLGLDRLVRRGLLSTQVYDELEREINEHLLATYSDDWKPPRLQTFDRDNGLPEPK